MLIASSENQDRYLGCLADTLIRKRSPGQGGPPYASMSALVGPAAMGATSASAADE
jgi:hypothetical protein